MKKEFEFILFVMLIIIFVSFTQAVSLEMKPEYKQRETLIAEINGNILEPLTKENVEFKRKNVLISLDFDVSKIGESYYVWAITPESNNNYTLIIKNVATLINGENRQVDIEKNFTVLGELSDYSIKPGAILTNKDFEITVNSALDKSTTITTDFPNIRNIEISPGENTIYYTIKDFVGSRSIRILIGQYSILAYIIGNQSSLKEYKLVFNPGFINEVVLFSSKDRYFYFDVFNNGTETNNVTIQYNKSKFVVNPANSSVRAGETARFNITIKANTTGTINDNIYVKFGNYSNYMPFGIQITTNLSNVTIINQTNNTGNQTLKRCFELSGTVCTIDQTCSISSINSLDGPCCKGICEDRGKGEFSWLGFILIGIALILVIVLLLNYKKVKAKLDPIKDRLSSLQARKNRDVKMP